MLGVLAMGPGVEGQTTTELLTTQLPFPAYVPIQDDHYGLRIGRLQVRYDVSTEFVFTDNRNFTSNDRESDLGIRPVLNLGLFFPINERQRLQVDVGIGYQWFLNVTDQNQFYIAPRSHLSYAVGVGEVDLIFSNVTSSSSEASSRSEFAGGSTSAGTDIAFNRINNRTSVGADWKPGRLGFGGQYAFDFDRSLNDQFTSLDRDRHSFSGSIDYEVSAPLTLGIGGGYSVFTFLDEVQNDGSSFNVGPRIEWQVRDNISLIGSVGYGESNFDQTGTIQDRDAFAGLVFDASIRHRINRYLSHSANFNRTPDTGFGSNFTDRTIAGYTLSADVGPKIRPYFGFSYEAASLSGVDAEDADLYRFNVGAGVPLWRRATLGLNYNLTLRESDLPDRGYTENRVVLNASYRF